MKLSVKTILILAALVLPLCFIGCDGEDEGGFDIVTSVFLPCDFAKTIAGERANVTQLLPPGAEGHGWEPTPKALRTVASADLFIYVGGGGDSWAEALLSSADVSDAIAAGRLRVLCLYDSLDLSPYYDAEEQGEDHAHDVDTHFWTSPRLAKTLAESIAAAIIECEPDGAELYRANRDALLSELDRLDAAFGELAGADGKLYFGDKFAFYYLCHEYGIDYLSPYAGCGENALPIDRVVVQMKEEVRERRVAIIFCEEYNSSSALSASIAAESGAVVRELHSCHNLNKSDSDASLGYVTLMERNLELIKEALGVSADGTE